MRSQIALALDNLAAVLESAGMDLSHISRHGIYATDMDEAPKSFDLLRARFRAVQNIPPMTLPAVPWLAIPGLLSTI